MGFRVPWWACGVASETAVVAVVEGDPEPIAWLRCWDITAVLDDPTSCFGPRIWVEEDTLGDAELTACVAGWLWGSQAGRTPQSVGSAGPNAGA